MHWQCRNTHNDIHAWNQIDTHPVQPIPDSKMNELIMHLLQYHKIVFRLCIRKVAVNMPDISYWGHNSVPYFYPKPPPWPRSLLSGWQKSSPPGGQNPPPPKRTHTLGQRVQGLRLWSEFQRAWPEQIWGFRNSHPATPSLALSRGLSGLASMKRAWLAPARCGPFFTSGTHRQPLKQPLVFRNGWGGVKVEGPWQQ